MNTLFRALAVPTLLLLALAVACGGDDDDDGPTTGSETDLAAAMVLTLDDVPPDWTSEPAEADDPEAPDPFEECDPGEPEGKTGEADSHDFAPSDTATLSQEIAIFEDSDAVLVAFESADTLADCLEEIVNEGGIDTDSATYSEATVEPLDLGEFGDDSRGFRVAMVAEPVDPGEGPEDIDVVIDVVLVVIDRVGMTVQVADIFSPFEEETLIDTVATAEEKVRTVLDQGTPEAEE